MKIHFVYAGSPDNGSSVSPYTITRNLYKYLASKAEVRYYEWSSGSEIIVEPEDVVIGHPNYPEHTPIQKFFASGQQCRLKCLIHPLHTAKVEDNWPFNHLAQKADKIFSICGPYWYDTIESTVFGEWKPKITRLDMAIDTDYWTHQKSSFRPVGQRRILYVGSSIPNKNLGLLLNIIHSMPDTQFVWYGGSSDHPIFKCRNATVTGWVDMNKQTIAQICSEADFLISTSTSDANPTTLLEFGLGSGLIPICTKESGYYNDESFINIPTSTDAVEIIKHWLNQPEHVLQEMSDKNRKKAEAHYNWDVFCNKIGQELFGHP